LPESLLQIAAISPLSAAAKGFKTTWSPGTMPEMPSPLLVTVDVPAAAKAGLADLVVSPASTEKDPATRTIGSSWSWQFSPLAVDPWRQEAFVTSVRGKS